MTGTETIESALDAVEEVFFLCAVDGTVQDWNESLVQVTGQADNELDGTSVSDFIEGSDIDEHIETVIETGKRRVVRADMLTGGGAVPYECSLSPVGDKVGVVGRRVDESTVKTEEIATRETMPVVEIWEGVLLASIIGKLTTDQAERLTEELLDEIVEVEATIALLDITGVQSIDTQTAQHLIDTIEAVDLLGAEVIITGINPDISQTLVKLGIGFDVETRASPIDGLRKALEMKGVELKT